MRPHGRYFEANAAIIPIPTSLDESGMLAVCVPVEETVVSYQPAVLVEDAGRLVNPGNVSQLSWTL
jgi:hypothetical protein